MCAGRETIHETNSRPAKRLKSEKGGCYGGKEETTIETNTGQLADVFIIADSCCDYIYL